MVWYIMPNLYMMDMEIWGFVDMGFDMYGWFGAPWHYDAIYKNAQSPTILHFTPLLDCLEI